MALSLFVSIDNNFKTRILTQTLIKYKILANYNWIPICIFEVISNLSPIVLFTNNDLMMIAAIQITYPQTQHLMCTENIKKKAKSKLHGKIINNFIEDFYHMRNSYTQYQFELRYKEMLTKYELY